MYLEYIQHTLCGVVMASDGCLDMLYMWMETKLYSLQTFCCFFFFMSLYIIMYDMCTNVCICVFYLDKFIKNIIPYRMRKIIFCHVEVIEIKLTAYCVVII